LDVGEQTFTVLDVILPEKSSVARLTFRQKDV